jgi:two-component system, NtrC family, response regulator AtoC
VIERAVVLSRGDTIVAADLPERITSAGPPREDLVADRLPNGTGGDPDVSPEEADRRRIIEVLDRCAGNQTRAAEELGISRRTLVSRLGKYRVPRPRKRDHDRGQG